MDTYRLGLHSSQRWLTASKMTMGLDPRLDPHLVQRILRGSRVFSGVDTSVDIVRLPLNRILVRSSPLLQLTMRKVGFEWSSRKVHRSRLAAARSTINYSSNSGV